MRTSWRTASAEVHFSPSRPQRVSSLPQRVCRPRAMAIVLIGRTLRMMLSSVSDAPSGTRRMNSIIVYGFGPSKPPPIATQVRFSGPVYTPRGTSRPTASRGGGVRRAGVPPAAPQPLHRLQLRRMGQLEMRLDAVGGQPLEVLLDP